MNVRRLKRRAARLCLLGALLAHLGLPGAHVVVHAVEAHAVAAARENVDGRGRRIRVVPSVRGRARTALTQTSHRHAHDPTRGPGPAPGHHHHGDGSSPLHSDGSPEHLGAVLLAAVSTPALPGVVEVAEANAALPAPAAPVLASVLPPRTSRGPPVA